ncbi:rubredoxin [Fusibacter sp. JL298sf-3]
MEVYKCTVCGYFYKPERGDWMSGIPKNTPFDEVPEDWRCPSCNQPKMAFVPVASK